MCSTINSLVACGAVNLLGRINLVSTTWNSMPYVWAIFTWEDDPRLSNTRIKIYCDNTSIRDVVNPMTSKCKNSLHLLRLLALNNLRFNRRIKIKYVESERNVLADALSRAKYDEFWDHAPSYMQKKPSKLPDQIWPIEKVWLQ